MPTPDEALLKVWKDDYRQSLRKLSIQELWQKRQEAQVWWQVNCYAQGAYDLTPLIDEEIRVRV